MGDFGPVVDAEGADGEFEVGGFAEFAAGFELADFFVTVFGVAGESVFVFEAVGVVASADGMDFGVVDFGVKGGFVVVEIMEREAATDGD